MTDETYVWAELRDDACERFGETPGAAVEERIVTVFSAHPALVAGAVAHVAAGWEAGRIRSPWPVLATHVEQEAQRVDRARSVTASGAGDAAVLEAKAERYLRQVGYLHQSEAEVRDELASRKWPVTERLVELWRSVRPLGEQVEAEQLERARRFREAHDRQHAYADSPTDKPPT